VCPSCDDLQKTRSLEKLFDVKPRVQPSRSRNHCREGSSTVLDTSLLTQQELLSSPATSPQKNHDDGHDDDDDDDDADDDDDDDDEEKESCHCLACPAGPTGYTRQTDPMPSAHTESSPVTSFFGFSAATSSPPVTFQRHDVLYTSSQQTVSLLTSLSGFPALVASQPQPRSPYYILPSN